MPIDPSKVTWDEAPAAQAINPEQVQWDDATQTGQPSAQPSKGAHPLSLGEVWRTMTGALPSVQDVGNIEAGALRGAGSIGATALWPLDKALDLYHGDRKPGVAGLVSGKQPLSRNEERRQAIDGGLQALGAETDSGLYKTGKIAGEIAGTAGVGGVLANGARVAGAAPSIVQGLSTGGLNVAGASGLPGMLLRGATGATTGAATAGLVNPEDAALGAAIGGALPVVAKAGAAGLHGLGSSLRGNLSPEVATLAKRAKELGVDIPVDRITNSKPLNAVASSLEYMPFSGRAATMDRTNSQLNKALSRTFGQDSDNVTMALRNASGELGGKFDDVLKNNTLRVDTAFMDDLAEHASRAGKELGSDGAKIIQNQIDEIIAKGAQGDIDGQAAYNIKKTLDRIGKRNSPEAYYALDLKKSLMGALDRSLGPDEAAAFAKTRQQYGNMLQLEKIAKNGAEGDISVARLANMKNVNNKELQELADIAAQFMVTRESPHGALQRLVIGGTGIGLGSGAGALPTIAALAAGGRATNSLLNSSAAKSLLMNTGTPNQGLLNGARKGLLGASKAAPVLTAQ